MKLTYRLKDGVEVSLENAESILVQHGEQAVSLTPHDEGLAVRGVLETLVIRPVSSDTIIIE